MRSDDFFEYMPLDELLRLVRDFCRKFGVTDAELQRLNRMSCAELSQYLRDLEVKRGRRSEGGTADG